MADDHGRHVVRLRIRNQLVGHLAAQPDDGGAQLVGELQILAQLALLLDSSAIAAPLANVSRRCSRSASRGAFAL
jgi:hypothetical protein